MNLSFDKLIWQNKEGLVAGAIVGYLLGKYVFTGMVDLNSIMSTTGFIDVVSSTATNTLEFAKTKLIWVSTIFGALIGWYIDYQIPEKRWFR